MSNILVIIKFRKIVRIFFLSDQKKDQQVQRRKIDIKRWAKTTKSLLFVNRLIVCLITMTKHADILRSMNDRAEDICMFLHCGPKWYKSVICCHRHVDVVTRWHNNINMTVLNNAMSITYKFSTQRIVEWMIGIRYSAWFYRKHQTSLIRPIRSNQALGRIS